MTRLALLLASTVLLGAPALAQQAAAPSQPRPKTQGGDHVHQEQSAEIVVTAPYVRELDILAGRAVVTGDELIRDIRPQIGDTLVRQPGVSATSFSPGSSRPVLRGFQGERVRVLTDGIGSIDASSTSADHAVTIDPLTAERIEVLHGPAVLLFGSQAIGGAVNVLDRRIPRVVPDEPIHIDVLGVYGSAADERSIGAAADLPLGNGGVVFHVDGSYRKTDDLRTGGYILSPTLRAEQLEVAEEELQEGHADEAEEALELASRRGRLPNSGTEQKTLGAGLAYIGNRGNIGASVSWFDSDYGVPSRPGGGHGHGAEDGEEHGDVPVTIGLKQIRADLRGELNLGGGFLDKVRVRLGAADYEHTEFEGEEVGTIFNTDGIEGRLELVQRDRGGWRGVTGAQFFTRDFAAVGPEAFLPPNETRQIGLFTLQEFELGNIGLEAAARYENTDVGAEGFDDRNFHAYSAAVGASYNVSPDVKLGINVSRAERAPAAEELFSSGPHVATQAFEGGDPALRKEKSWGGEVYARAQTRGIRFSASLFANKFDDYIFQAATGEEEDGLPVFQYFQRDATYYGFEAEASATLFQAGGFRFVGDMVGDYVRATVKEGGGPVPRIPPLRLLGGIEAQSERVDARVEAEWVDDQERVAEFETPTEGFTMINASVAWRPWGKSRNASLILAANNIFDVEARRHASFTKEFVPLAGRDIRLSARFSF